MNITNLPSCKPCNLQVISIHQINHRLLPSRQLTLALPNRGLFSFHQEFVILRVYLIFWGKLQYYHPWPCSSIKSPCSFMKSPSSTEKSPSFPHWLAYLFKFRRVTPILSAFQPSRLRSRASVVINLPPGKLYKKLWNPTIFHGKINYFYGYVQYKSPFPHGFPMVFPWLNYQRVPQFFFWGYLQIRQVSLAQAAATRCLGGKS